MQTQSQPAPISNARRWSGRIITGLVVLFLVFDGAAKVARAEPVLKASEQLRLPPGSIVPIGALLLLCTALYVIPRTAILGAILLSAYLGGAVAIHVSVSNGAFPVIFSIATALLAWLGLSLREPGLASFILRLRRT